MIRNYLKIAIRNLLRQRAFSFINIFGLALGIATCLLIALYVRFETSFDRYHTDADRIYRVVKDFVNDDGSRVPDATTPPAIAMAMQSDIPEIEHVTRLFPGWGRQYYIRYGDNRFIEEGVYRVDSSFFSVFTVPFVKGEPRQAFAKLKSVVISQRSAAKYFGSEDPMGKVLQLDDMGDYEVTGVFKNIPQNAHFNFDFLISIRTLNGNPDQQWGWYNFYTYIKLKKNTDIASVEPKIKAVFKKNQPENTNYFYTQALTSIHLTSNLKWELQPNGDITYVYVFICTGLFLIVIAGINYVNLSTAKSSLRAKEIGVRKVSGAFKSSLIFQFLSESVLMVLIAFLFAVMLTQLALPYFNMITAREFELFAPETYTLLTYALISVILLGVLAGFYPALYLSSFKPIQIMKGIRLRQGGIFSLRRVLVVLQFSISIILIIGIIVISQQLDFIQQARLGFEKDQVVVIKDIGYLSRGTRSSLKNSLNNITGVESVAASDGIIGGQNWTNGVRMKGSEVSILLNFLNIDVDYLSTMKLELKEGRGFSREFPGDTLDGIILNETAVRQLGVPEPVLGQLIVWGEDEDTVYYAKVIGVVKDFHFTSLRSEIKPFAFVTDNSRQWYFNVKVNAANLPETIDKIRETWNTAVPERPFQYYFLDTVFEKLYQSERNFRIVFLYGTTLAIIIACLGLFGLSAFVTEQRTKEIAIRKVIGSRISQLVLLLSKEFVSLVLISFFIAIPVAYFIVTNWLKDFAYRIDIRWWVFVIAGLAALVIALVTVSLQTIKAATSDPVRSLRAE